MNDKAISTGIELTQVLETENAALRKSDYTAAVALVLRKKALIQALDGVIGRMQSGEQSQLLAAIGKRLRELAAENQDLLNRAIGVQAQIIRIVTQAGTHVQGTYTSFGQYTPAVRNASINLSAKA